MSYSRFGLYYLPPEGALATFGASWLGWDIAAGAAAEQPSLPGLDDITMTPRKYGFHGTLKPPFRLAADRDAEALKSAVAALASTLAPARCEGLELSRIGGFLALTPCGDASALRRLAEACVRELDEFRAPADGRELARRRQAGLTERQEAMLRDWGYPYVMEEFRFHLTLSGRLPEDEAAAWAAEVGRRLPALPAPFVVDEIALCGERPDGRFELVHRYALSG